MILLYGLKHQRQSLSYPSISMQYMHQRLRYVWKELLIEETIKKTEWNFH